MRSGGSKGQCARGTQTAKAVPEPGSFNIDKMLQRFRCGRRFRCNRELADGLDIELDRVPKKYAGLDGTELAISESQERMAVVVAAADCRKIPCTCKRRNLEATVVARVTDTGRMVMRWNGEKIVDPFPRIPEHKRCGEAHARQGSKVRPFGLLRSKKLPRNGEKSRNLLCGKALGMCFGY